jgi:hypothetical protein
VHLWTGVRSEVRLDGPGPAHADRPAEGHAEGEAYNQEYGRQ